MYLVGRQFSDTARYLVHGENPPWLAGYDVTEPAYELDYTLDFLPETDAFYTFQGRLGKRRRAPGRDAPPGAIYNTRPAFQPEAVQLRVFFWYEGAEGYAEDFAALDTSSWRPPDDETLRPFAWRFVEALPCRRDWQLPCRQDLP